MKENLTLKQQILIELSKITPDFMLDYITQNCSKWDTTKNKDQYILDYINDFKVDWKKAKRCKNIETVEECAKQFKSLNDFFQRKIDFFVEDYNSLCSPAECRIVAYKDIKESQKYWIKGKYFSVSSLLGKKSSYFKDCSIIICRLAPQDYHRFHFPLNCVYLGKRKIKGKYRSVNPSLINSSIDVLDKNKREIHYLYSDIYGVIAYIIIGATCVGSITTNCINGKSYRTGDYFGKFGFGGSTIVLLGYFNINDKILKRSLKSKETYVRVGMKLD